MCIFKISYTSSKANILQYLVTCYVFFYHPCGTLLSQSSLGIHKRLKNLNTDMSNIRKSVTTDTKELIQMGSWFIPLYARYEAHMRKHGNCHRKPLSKTTHKPKTSRQQWTVSKPWSRCACCAVMRTAPWPLSSLPAYWSWANRGIIQLTSASWNPS